MCGIWALFGHSSDSVAHCDCSFIRIRHRGPDAWRLQFDNRIKNSCIGFTRLTIVDSVYGMQPMTLHQQPFLTLLCNGELYNCKKLGKDLGFKYETHCDVECIIELFVKLGIKKAVSQLDGVFGFILIDSENSKLYAARDPYGVRPLFRLTSDNGVLGFCSEGKGLMSLGEEVMNGSPWTLKQFPPGHYAEYDILPSGLTKLVKEEPYYTIGDRPAFIPFLPFYDLKPTDILGNIRRLLTMAVKKRLMAERRIGCLLSGGLDSSLVAALLLKLAKEEHLPYKVQTFAIGMGESPDIVAARKVARHIESEHHEISFTPEDVARVLDKVIYQLETFDITTVRASIGMYLISEYIKENTDSTVIMSGEGADELAQGYIYFRDAPDSPSAHQESLRLLQDIHLYDGLRADRTTAAHSLELRVPFLDLQFTHYYLSLPLEIRRPKDQVEKYLLRSAFANEDLLPNEILWRHKEAFSDGVTTVKKSLFQIIQEYVESKIPDEALSEASKLYPHLTPKTKESFYYRQVFEKHFPGRSKDLTPYFWMPKWIEVSDPSARFIKHYAAKAD